MPDFIGNNLIVRILHHKADLRGLLQLAHSIQRLTVKENIAAALAVRGQNGF